MGIGASNSFVFVYGFSAFFIPWQRAFGWSRAVLGGVVGVSRLEGGLVAPVAGWFIDRYGPRRIMFVGLAMMGFGFFALAQVTTLLMLYVVFLTLLATGSSFGTMRPAQVALAHWFVRRRGLAMGLLLAGPGIGGSFVFLFAQFMDTYGWQRGAIVSGILIWSIGFPLAWVIRHKPEQMGLLPDGDRVPAGTEVTPVAGGENSTPQEVESQDEASASLETLKPRHFWMRDPRPEIELSVWQALRTRAFWLTALTWAIFAAMPGITTVHIAPFLAEELELDYVVAVSALSFFVFASLFGRVGFGFVADYVNIRLLVAGLLITQAVGIFLFSEVQTLAQVPFYIIIFAVPYGGMLPMRSVIQGYFFGRKAFGTIGGFLQFVDLPATVAAPIWVGYLADTLPGGYRIGFKIIAATLVIAVVAILLARRPRPPLPADQPPLLFQAFRRR
jgi:MFS family permease